MKFFLQRYMRRMGYYHIDEVQPLISQAYDTGIMQGYNSVMCEVRSPQEAMLTLTALHHVKEGKKGMH